nr:nodulation protein [Melilotus officinalis]
MPNPTCPAYDVFLSFRGEDTRDNFKSHVYAELDRKKIKTFIDDKLERGDEISPSLIKAIEESSIYVVILSKHYASSTWCLDELTKILECKRKYKREVIPVFYDVDPSDVRHQRKSYAEDFERYQERYSDRVDEWKAGLTEVANLSGWDSKVTRPESTLVEKIAEDISKKLNHCVSGYEGMVGVDEHIERIQPLLLLESAAVRIIGIWGMGGIGKTTIASAIYRQLASQFSCRSIVLNVQQEIQRAGLDQVRNKYLSQLLGEDIKSSDSNFSFDPRLKRIKVLLVLDDVKDSDQLKDLIGTHSNFGQGSRIIVTSRDKQVLKNANADEIYQVKEMDSQDSLQLFCLCAFKQNHPIEPYVSLSKKVLDYAKGVPIALKVLGLFLQGRTKEVWESELQKLEKLPERKIFDVLKSSYDGLDDEQKDIFLDIACFYRGEVDKVVAQKLDFCGFSALIGMDVLKDRCLISISEHMVEMHDLIQEMGHEIVRQQWPNDLGKRSRLWKPDDIYDVLKKNKGKSEIRGIFLDMSEIKEVQLSAEAFKKMHNLRIIQFYNSSDILRLPNVILSEKERVSNVTFHVCLESLPDDLKFLRWDGFPQRSLPQYFCPEILVALEMPYSDLEELWERDQALPNLKRLDLRKSMKLIEVPDLSLSPNIEEIILSECVSLVQVYSSSFLNDLNWLCLDRCTNLKSLNIPSNILSRSYGLVALNGCLNLETLLISSRTDVFRSYSCSRFDGILDRLIIHMCNEEMGLWTNSEEGYKILDDMIEEDDPITFKSINEFCWLDVSNCESLTSLPAELLNLKFLRRLNLGGCLKLEELPEIEETMENITVLILDETAIKELLPSSLHRLVGLEELSLRSCKKLKTIPSSIGNLSKLLKLDLTYCVSLETFPSSIFKLKLTKLHLRGCSMLRTFPEIPGNIGRLSSLTKLSLQGSSIVNLPESMAHLSSLKSLKLSDCKWLECIPKLPPLLNQLLAFDCPSIKRVVSSSTLKLLSDSKDGTFRFHFTNSTQQLDASFLSIIGAEAWYKITDDAYRSVFFCFPGSAVPG